ncbi:MAG: hypothetical protein QM740_17790 [Acidovorax sp.]
MNKEKTPSPTNESIGILRPAGIFLLATTVAVVVLGLITKEFSFVLNLLIGAFFGILCALFQISTQYEKLRLTEISDFGDKIESLNKNLCDQLKLSNVLTYRGSYISLLQEQNSDLLELSQKATKIKNTMIFCNPQDAGKQRVFSDVAISNRTKYIRNALDKKRKNGIHWTDIYSRNILRLANPMIERITNECRGSYSAWVIEKDHPVVNLILFKCDDFSEVWFGFGLLEEMEDGPIYSTREPNLVAYFDKYFEELKKKAREWEINSPEHIPGGWVSVSYNAETKILLDIAITRISPSNDRGDYNIEGNVYEPSPGGGAILKREFETIWANLLYEGKEPVIYFSHRDKYPEISENPRQNQNDRRWGCGRYRFIYSGDFSEYKGSVQAMGGETRELFGRKLSVENFNKIKKTYDSGCVELIEALLSSKVISTERPAEGVSPFRPSAHFSSRLH